MKHMISIISSPLRFSNISFTFYIEKFEEQAISSASLKPRCWFWYVDDTFVAVSYTHLLSMYDYICTHINAEYTNVDCTNISISTVCLLGWSLFFPRKWYLYTSIDKLFNIYNTSSLHDVFSYMAHIQGITQVVHCQPFCFQSC